ncbi:sensor histidine kinase KdpD [Pedobacter sp. MC2016-24]|uniref:sensor histidine kinase n=1 Tax=Pedobacter sp. MC2016-24 TaxID=2780090 RepID=UPI0018821147|nr:HAMP domain-containing sensor histidine kinase [Pedobacter sp. MC2016-24]MBE9602090.1 HAMP domain-containing histidine kinase [Pedobacter sp. MC2016-24]
MLHRIKYIQYLMIFCILGVILTQGYWLYKDYNYYSGQPLFSADYSFFQRVQTVSTIPASDLQIVKGNPANAAGFTPMGKLINAGIQVHAVPASRMPPDSVASTSLPSIVAYPSTTAQTLPAGVTPRLNAVSMGIPAMASTSLYKPVLYKAPLSYVLQKMKLQFGVSILLILFTTTCFIFMSITIFRQSKLSVAKNNFINNMTHELKTPLATVSVAVEAMRNFGAWDDQRKAQLYLNISKNEIDHLSKLIELILQQSIFESHKMELSIKFTDVNRILKDVTDNYALSNKQVQIFVTCAADIPLIPVDAVHMSNVFRNLIDNAIKYSSEEKIIRINSEFQNQHWKLSVSDNGIGIPKIYQKDVFERFFRVPNGDVNPIKGFGLGLSYIKQVVSLHNGSISLQSIEHYGSVFTISIPFKQNSLT